MADQDPWSSCREPAFLVQVMPMLRSVRVTARSPHGIAPRIVNDSDSSVRIDFPGHPSPLAPQAHDPATRPPLSHAILRLPSKLDTSYAPQITANGDAAEARFTLAHADAAPRHKITPGLDGVSALHCGTCGAILTKASCFDRVLPLPSPFWHELAEMWICHDDFRCLSPMAKLSESDMRARPGHCLYSEHTMLIHASDLDGCVEWGGQGDPGSLWGLIRCSRCQGPLGSALMESQSIPSVVAPPHEGTKPKQQQQGRKVHSRRARAVDPTTGATAVWMGGEQVGSLPIGAAGAFKPSVQSAGLTVVMPDGSSIPWSELSQPGTSAPEGTVGTQSQGGPRNDVRVFKQWTSSSSSPGGPDDVLKGFTLLKRVSYELIETAAAHSSYRFAIRATDASLAPRALVSLLGNTAAVCSSSFAGGGVATEIAATSSLAFGEGGSATAGGVARVMSCTYEVCDSDGGTWQALLRQWTQASVNDIEQLDLLDEECGELCLALVESTMLLPPSQRLLGGMAVGFIPVG